MNEMTELERSVVEQAHQRGKKALERSKLELKRDYEQVLENRKQELQETFQRKKTNMRQELEQETQQIDNERRMLLLESKQKVLNELFSEALKRMNQSDEESQLNFLKKVLESISEKEFVVTFGEDTQQVFSEHTWNHLRTEYPNAQFNDETIYGTGGFLISVGRVDYNYLYEKMIRISKESLSQDIIQRIFDKD